MLSQLLQNQLRSNSYQRIAENCNTLPSFLQASSIASKAGTYLKCPAKVGHFFAREIWTTTQPSPLTTRPLSLVPLRHQQRHNAVNMVALHFNNPILHRPARPARSLELLPQRI